MYEIRGTVGRVRGFLGTGYTHYLRASGHVRASGSAEISGGQPPTLEQRVRNLEERLDRNDADHHRIEDALRKEFGDDLRGTIEDTEKTINQRIETLARLAVGAGLRPWWKTYGGPILIGFGILCGLAAAVVGAQK